MASIARFVDVFGFVSLSRLFTAHITGNIVIAIAELINHTPGVAAKLITLPVFMVVAMLVTWWIEHIGQTRSLLATLLRIEALLLTLFMALGSVIIPMGAVSSWEYIATGMLAVSAMAIHKYVAPNFYEAISPEHCDDREFLSVEGGLCKLLLG